MKRQARAMTEDEWRRWDRVRSKGLRRFVLRSGGAMAVLWFVGFSAVFGAAVRVVSKRPVQWGALLAVTAPGAIAFGLIVSLLIWRGLEGIYHSTPPPEPEPGHGAESGPPRA